MSDFVNITRKHLLNIRGRRLKTKYVIFESDDWGSERIPSRESLNYLASCGIDVHRNPFNFLDSLETDDDLSALYEILIRFKDIKGNYPAITANYVTANPDFERIRTSGFREYFYENFLETYRSKKGCENAYPMIKEGIAAGIFHPQCHGREHLNVRQWLVTLQNRNELLLKAFNAGIYGIDLEYESMMRPNFTAAFDAKSDREFDEHRNIIRQGLALFKDIFGYSSRSFIAPCYVWHPSLEILLNENGIKYIQGLPIQYIPTSSAKYVKKYHYQGERNKMQQIYFVRNCFFEPALNARFNWIEDCFKRLKIIFYWGKPAIIGCHRLNFIGSLNEENRNNNLRDLSILLRLILKTWPDVEFTTTDKLGEIYRNFSKYEIR
jgi:hypothetical protein